MLVARGGLRLVSSFNVWLCLDLEKLLSLFQLQLRFSPLGFSSWQPSLPWCRPLLSGCFTRSQFRKVEKIFNVVLLDQESSSLVYRIPWLSGEGRASQHPWVGRGLDLGLGGGLCIWKSWGKMAAWSQDDVVLDGGICGWMGGGSIFPVGHCDVEANCQEVFFPSLSLAGRLSPCSA